MQLTIDQINKLTVDDLLDLKAAGKKIELLTNLDLNDFKLTVQDPINPSATSKLFEVFQVSQARYNEFTVYFDDIMAETKFLRHKAIGQMKLKGEESPNDESELDTYAIKYLDHIKTNFKEEDYKTALGGFTSFRNCYIDLKPRNLGEFALITFCLTLSMTKHDH
jgi:hypothetical protein